MKTRRPDVVEQVVEDAGNKSAKAHGWEFRKVKWLGHRGAPDRFYRKAGVGSFFVEYKRPGEEPRPNQVIEIQALRDAGQTVHVIDTVEMAKALFWGDEMITEFQGEYRWLSNFESWPVMLAGEEYPTVEHAYQAAKFDCLKLRAKIRNANGPGHAKKLANQKQSKAKVSPGFHDRKLLVMRELLRQKFSEDPYRSLLIITGPRQIVEGNTWGDTFWGVCNGTGQNNLGKLIMEIRTDLKEGNDLAW